MSYRPYAQPRTISEALRTLGARKLFKMLNERRLAERPVIGRDRKGGKVYGPSTFQNRIEYKRDATGALILENRRPVEVHV